MKAVLVITDGIGYSKKQEYNAFLRQKAKLMTNCFKKFPLE